MQWVTQELEWSLSQLSQELLPLHTSVPGIGWGWGGREDGGVSAALQLYVQPWQDPEAHQRPLQVPAWKRGSGPGKRRAGFQCH